MATREEYLKICRDWDPETQEMWFGKSCKMHAGHGDPAEIGPSIWSQNGYEIRPKRRELGQWIFEGASASTISAHKDMDGVWKFSSYDRTLSVIHVHGLSHQPTGLDHIRPEESLIVRDPPHLVSRIQNLEAQIKAHDDKLYADVQEERERCARICDSLNSHAGDRCAEMIREQKA